MTVLKIEIFLNSGKTVNSCTGIFLVGKNAVIKNEPF